MCTLYADIVGALKAAAQQRLLNASPTRRLVSVTLLLLFLFVLSLAQFESLHRIFHSDAAEADHTCAVTLLRTGQVDAPVNIPVVAAAPVLALADALPFLAPVFVSFEFLLLPSCGPPALIS